MSKIEKLTPEQEQKLVEFREEWLKIGLATGEADISAITPTINEFYKRISQKAPYIWHCKSPIEAQILINLMKNKDFLLKNIRGILTTNVGFNIPELQLHPRYGDIRDQEVIAILSFAQTLKDEIEALVGTDARRYYTETYGDEWVVETANRLMPQLIGIVQSLKFEYTNCYLYGSLDAYWIAWLLFPHIHLRPMHTVDQMELLRHWENLARNCFWWYPFEGVCFVCDRPVEIHKDERGRLHSLDTPAVSFSDGWKLYYVNGVEIPPYVVEHPEQITVKDILDERNVEVRRVKMDKYGNARFVVDAKAKLLSSDGYGDLFGIDIPDDEALLMVKVVNATPEQDGTYRDYWIRVPPDTKTAHEGVAWTFSKKPEDYAPEIQT